MNLELLKKRRALDFAEKLAKLAAKSPDVESKQKIYVAANYIRQTYGLSVKEKQEIILEAIENGAITQSDICEETNLRVQDVSEILKQLKKERKVKTHKMSITSSGGRPSEIWLLT